MESNSPEKKELRTSEILVGIGYFLGDQKFVHDWEGWNKFFYKMKGEYAILRGLSFKKDYPFPESENLREAYSALVQSLLLERLSAPSPKFPHRFSQNVKKIFEKDIEPYLNPEELGELEGLAKEFLAEFTFDKI